MCPLEVPEDLAADQKSSTQEIPQKPNPLLHLLEWWGTQEAMKLFEQAENKVPNHAQRREEIAASYLQQVGLMFAQTFETLIAKGYQREVEEFLTRVQQAGAFPSEPGVEIARDTAHYQLWVEFASLAACAAYLERGDQAALERLPAWFDLDCAAFLQKPWISELIASWYQRGETQKIEQLFSPTPRKKGKASFASAMKLEQRDRKIFEEMDKRLERGEKPNQTARYISNNWQALGLTEKMSPENVKRIYRERQQGHSHLRALYL